MKVGVVTDDGKTISPHFGRAEHYLVYDIQAGVVKGKELRAKAGCQHGGMDHHGESSVNNQGRPEASAHEKVLSNVRDCEALVARGMGLPMYEAIRELGIKPFLTERVHADEAVQAYIQGILDDHPERLQRAGPP